MRHRHEVHEEHKEHRKHGGHVKRRAKGGEVTYEGAGSNVEKEAEERKHGGRVKKKKHGGEVEGKHPKHRLDRPGRKRGGAVGADLKPLSTANREKQAMGHKTEDDEED